VRVRAFGTFDFRIVDPKVFLKEVAGTDNHFRLDEFHDTMRSRIVSVFTDAVASARIPVLDLATRYQEVGDAILPLINPQTTTKYGIEITSFILENASVPPEVEAAIDKRSSMSAVGNLNDYVKFQMAEGIAKGEAGGGVGGQMTQFAMGIAMAQQMSQQAGGVLGQTIPPAGAVPPPLPGAVPPATGGGTIPDLMSPADAARALGVTEAFGVGAGSNIGRAAFLIITYTATIFDKMVIAGASSITARGAIERVGEVHVLWSQWFLAYLPCDIITILIAWRLTLWLYPPEKPALDADAGYLSGEQASIGRWDAQSTRAALLIALAIGLWLTDFLHHISPAVIGLGVGLATVLPGVGVLTVDDLKRVNYLPVFFVATAVSMGEVLAETKGPKIRIIKFKNKTGYKKRQGHRQRYTQVKVTGIKG